MRDTQDDDFDDNVSKPRSRREPLKFEDYGERWPLHPLDSFVEISNDRDVEARCEIFIGPTAPGSEWLHVQLERLRPKADQLSVAVMNGLLEKRLPLRREYLSVRLTIPSRTTVKVPRTWLPALRKVADGRVVAGQIPWDSSGG